MVISSTNIQGQNIPQTSTQTLIRTTETYEPAKAGTEVQTFQRQGYETRVGILCLKELHNEDAINVNNTIMRCYNLLEILFYSIVYLIKEFYKKSYNC